MHDSVKAFVTSYVNSNELWDDDVLDIGSRDVNGTLRDLFTGNYIGIDVEPGPNVDMVVDANELMPVFGVSRFDLVVCCEMIEHDKAFWKTLAGVNSVLRPGGHMLLTTRGVGFKEHCPPDYWRFTPESGSRLLELAGLKGETTADPQQSGIFVTGRKHGA